MKELREHAGEFVGSRCHKRCCLAADRIEQLMAEVEKQKKDIARSNADCADVAATYQEQEAEIDRLDAETEVLRADCKGWRLDCVAWEAQCEEQAKEVEQLKKQVSDKRQSYRETVAHFKKYITRLQADVDNYQLKAHQLATALSDAEEKITSLKAEVERLRLPLDFPDDVYPAKDVYQANLRWSVKCRNMFADLTALRVEITRLQEERDKLLLAIGDHVTVRSGYYEQITRLQDREGTAFERAAKLVEDHGHSGGRIRGSHKHLAAAIRALSTDEGWTK